VRISGYEGNTKVENSTAWQKYLPSGPLALLPLWDGYCSIVWSTTVSEAKRLVALTLSELAEEINAALQVDSLSSTRMRGEGREEDALPSWLTRLPLLSTVANSIRSEMKGVMATVKAGALLQSPPFRLPPRIEAIAVGDEAKGSGAVSFPLSFRQARRYIAPSGRVVLVGDAAHSIHPQAGQGLNLGLLDAETLADVLVQSLNVGEDIGSIKTLQRYEEDRYWKNLSMMATVDVLDTMFKGGKGQGWASRRFEEIRSTGLLGVNAIPPLKEAIARFAIGHTK
jgi:ubiquinone biosynthesis monooxygenase Coq6